jgi:hypothetical protein
MSKYPILKQMVTVTTFDFGTHRCFYAILGNVRKLCIRKPNFTNPKHQPMILTNDFRIQGIVEKIISL